MVSLQAELLILELRREEVSHNQRRTSPVEDSPGRTWGSGWRAAQRNLCRTLHLQDCQNRTSSSAMDPLRRNGLREYRDNQLDMARELATVWRSGISRRRFSKPRRERSQPAPILPCGLA